MRVPIFLAFQLRRRKIQLHYLVNDATRSTTVLLRK